MDKKKVCNVCGNEFNMYDDIDGYSIHKKVGYGSKYDGKFMHMNICIKCMDKLIDSCRIKPVISEI